MSKNISVITPLYQGADHIEQCMQSVLMQRRSDIEHIIIDNNSTDNGPSLVEAFARKHSHVRLLHNETPGSGPTRNVGIREATGRYIAFLDCDDWWDPKKCDVQMKEMQDKKLAFSWSAYTVVGPQGSPLRLQKSPSRMTVRRHLMKFGTIGCLTAMYDTEQLGKLYMNDLGLRQDFCLWYDILSQCEMWGLKSGGTAEALAYYRVHGAGISANKKKASVMQWRAYRDHVGLGLINAGYCFTSYAANGLADRLRGRISPKP